MIKVAKTLIFLMSFSSTIMFPKELQIGLESFEPYYYADNQSGIIPDLIKAVFHHIPGYQLNFQFGHSNKRLLSDFISGKWDGVPNLSASTTFEGCITEPIFIYKNVAVTLVRSNFNIQKISELSNYSVVTFQGALDVMGTEFSQAINPKLYTEVINNSQQFDMLYRERVDVSIGDKFIFIHNLKRSSYSKASLSDFSFHELFEPTYTHMGFHDPEICPKFNKALQKIRKSGEYEKIYLSYQHNNQ